LNDPNVPTKVKILYFLRQKSCLGILLIILVAASLSNPLLNILYPSSTHVSQTTIINNYRESWDADPPKPGIEKMKLPIITVIATQTADQKESCFTSESCNQRVKAIQVANNHLKDIPFNFLIGGDGRVYEGRGFLFQGESMANISLNSIGISVAFIGTFNNQQPNQTQVHAFSVFIDLSVSKDWITQSYFILLQDQLENRENVTTVGLLTALETFDRFHSSKMIHNCVIFNS